MTGRPDPLASAPPRAEQHLAEVWGDVVDLRHLAAAVAVGAVVSVGLYFAAGRLFAAIVGSAEVARSYAMLVGLLGCVAGGAISARLFSPKRVMTELVTERPDAAADASSRDGFVGDLPDEVRDEMRALGLHDTAGTETL